MGVFYYYDLEYSEVFVFDDYIINQMREGSTITKQKNSKLKKLIDTHFQDKPVVCISNRIFSYSVDPMTYIETSKIQNLLAIAIVTDNKLNQKNAVYESEFYTNPFKVFDNVSDAIIWARQIIVEHQSS